MPTKQRHYILITPCGDTPREAYWDEERHTANDGYISESAIQRTMQTDWV